MDEAPGGESAEAADGADAALLSRCDYCRLPIPLEPVTETTHGETYAFCSAACRDAMHDRESVFTEYHGHRRVTTGVAGIDRGLPQGLPRNAFVLLSGQAGTRHDALLAELAWSRLQRDDPVVYVTFQEPPGAVVQTFLTLDWNVLPYLERGQLRFVDCFTDRMDDPDRMRDRLSDWNRHLHTVAGGATATVRDPTDMAELANKLDNQLGALDMTDRGAAIVDSLTELGTLVQPIQAYDVVKDLRADVCKGRFVPIFAGATYRNDDEFPHDLAYTVDGVVDLELDPSAVEDTLLKRVRIRKMAGVLAIPQWTTYEYTSGEGMVTFDPEEEMRKSGSAAVEAADDGTGTEPPEGDGDADPDAPREATTDDRDRPPDDDPDGRRSGRGRPE